jgi:WD40 repeat protein
MLNDGKIKIWDAQTGVLLREWQGHTETVYYVSYSPNNNYIVSASFDCTLKVWHVKTGELLAVFCDEAPIHHCSYSPDSKHIAALNMNGYLLFLHWIE